MTAKATRPYRKPHYIAGLVSVIDLSERSGLALRTLYRWIEKGLIEPPTETIADGKLKYYSEATAEILTKKIKAAS